MPALRDLITDGGLELTPSERKVIRALLDQYPRNGLGPMSRLAEHAGVSDPTIVRLVKKLGFSGYADFQDALLSEMDHRLRSPSAQLQPRPELPKGDTWSHSLEHSHRALEDTHASDAARRHPDTRRVAARHTPSGALLWRLFQQFPRPLFAQPPAAAEARLFCPGRQRSTAGPRVRRATPRRGVVFDYRRYQSRTLRLTSAVKNRYAQWCCLLTSMLHRCARWRT